MIVYVDGYTINRMQVVEEKRYPQKDGYVWSEAGVVLNATAVLG